MSELHIAPSVIEKIINKHGLSVHEVRDAFAGRLGTFLVDQREAHDSDPKTLWFIGETSSGKKIKVAFIPKDGKFIIRTAYVANPIEIKIYEKHAI